jgi:hypothetical protein
MELADGANHGWLVRQTPRSKVVAAEYGAGGVVVRKIRGQKCRTVSGLMDEIGAAFQLFVGFGANWHALEECLSYLDEWMPGPGYVFVVEQAGLLLIDEPGERQYFFAVLTDVIGWWSRPVVGNGRFNRDSIPFSIVLEFDGAEDLPPDLPDYVDIEVLNPN